MEKTIKINLARYLYNVKEDTFYKVVNGLIVGRSKGTITFPNDAAMSGVHAKFSINHGEVCVEDLNSTNGIRLNNLLIRPQKMIVVALGNAIDVGEQTFILTDQDFARPKITMYIENKRPKVLGLFNFKFYTLQTKIFLFFLIFSYIPPVIIFLIHQHDKSKMFLFTFYFFYSCFSFVNFYYNLKTSYTNNSLGVALTTFFLWSVQTFICTLATYLIDFILF